MLFFAGKIIELNGEFSSHIGLPESGRQPWPSHGWAIFREAPKDPVAPTRQAFQHEP